MKALPKQLAGKGEAAGRHQSAPRSGRGDEAGAGGNAQAAGRERNAHQRQDFKQAAQQVPHAASGSLRGQQRAQGQDAAARSSGEVHSASNTSSAVVQGHHGRKQSHHVGQYQNLKIDNSRHAQVQLNQSQHIPRGIQTDKDGKLYLALDDSRAGDGEGKKKSHQGSKRTTANALNNQANAGSESSALDSHMYQKGAAADEDSHSIQPKQQARVNGNTFKNYNGKKIISI